MRVENNLSHEMHKIRRMKVMEISDHLSVCVEKKIFTNAQVHAEIPD